MNIDFQVINLAAILIAVSYDNAQPVIKWGGLIVAVVSVVNTFAGGWLKEGIICQYLVNLIRKHI